MSITSIFLLLYKNRLIDIKYIRKQGELRETEREPENSLSSLHYRYAYGVVYANIFLFEENNRDYTTSRK